MNSDVEIHKNWKIGPDGYFENVLKQPPLYPHLVENANDQPLVGIFRHSKHGLVNNRPEIVWMEADKPSFNIHW